MERVEVKVINKSKYELPSYSTELSAGMDLRANIDEIKVVKPFERVLIPTGLFIQLPDGYEVQIRPRSGLALKKGVTILNSPGTIDCLTGDTRIPLLNGTVDSLENIVNRVNSGEEIYVYSVDDSDGHISPGLVTNAVRKGSRDILKVTFDNGTVIKCTPSHEFRTYKGTYIKASDLTIGTSVSPLNRKYDKDGYELLGSLKYGQIGRLIRCHRAIYSKLYSDSPEVVHHIDENVTNNDPRNLVGMTHKDHYKIHPSHSKMHEWINTEEGISHAKEFGNRVTYNENRLNSLKNNPNMKGCLGYKFTDEQRLNSSVSAKKSWENPSKIRMENAKRCIVESNLKVLNDPEKLKNRNEKILLSKINRSINDIILPIINSGEKLSEGSYNKYKKEVSKSNKKPYLRFNTIISRYNSIDDLILSVINHKVSSIEPYGTEEVFDITIDKYHNFVAEDIFVHNCDYTGEICIILVNLSNDNFEVNPGDRIAQMVLSKVPQITWNEVESLEETERGTGGFGHTGVK